jgi:hypothetical protein
MQTKSTRRHPPRRHLARFRADRVPERVAAAEAGHRQETDRRGESPPACAGIGRPDALTSEHMTDEKQDRQRADRNRGRSEEAHWQVAEAGAEEEDRLVEAARLSDKQQDDWENEGGALDREPRETTEQGDPIPVPKLGKHKKVSEPERK